MELNWMGRYRPLVAALVLHTNILTRGWNNRMDCGDGVFLTPPEWQVLECIVEHEEGYLNMIEIARQIGIPQSSFSRIVKTLRDDGLIVKYQVAGNRKNVILRPSESGRSVYRRMVSNPSRSYFQVFFKELESLSDEDIYIFTKALNKFTLALPTAKDSQEVKLIEME
ncbi:MAG: MarR family transcriptional regulator [Oscillospiraceae bacterium]|nr:MarR family transcriptional regulator [Oscillospiraceae bacterium]